MPELTFTKQQQDAIDARGGTVLVSAAAGSGKTAVLTERVIAKITDPENPVDIDRLVIVTFTNAAAAEMRVKIAQKLDRLLEDNPQNAHLKRQKILLAKTYICTIHKFCADILKENFEQTKLSGNFRIADQTALQLLRDDAMREVFAGFYRRGDQDFFRLLDLLSAGRDDRRLMEVVARLYDFIRSHPFPNEWLERIRGQYDPDIPFEKSVWFETAAGETAQAMEYACRLNRKAIDLCRADEKISAAYLPALQTDGQFFENLKESVNQGWDAMTQAYRAVCFHPLGRLMGYDDEQRRGQVKDLRDETKNIVNKLGKILSVTADQHAEDMTELSGIISVLCNLVTAFDEGFSAKKQGENSADFSDLEHYAIGLFLNKQGETLQKTPLAERLADYYDEILIDEYQDVNEAQELLFSAISNGERNLFMAGDVKQSIYRFRQAKPEIFIRKRKAFADYDGEIYPATVILGKNFRSRRGIIDCVNFTFRQLMSEPMGEIEYNDSEALIYGADYPESDTPDVEFVLIDQDADRHSGLDVDELEGNQIARMIEKMRNEGRTVNKNGVLCPIEYGDICILHRSANRHGGAIAKELVKCGIPVKSEQDGDFFDALEIKTAVSLLRAVDNPMLDIPLAAAMMSPIFGFTPDDLARIRLSDKEKPLYTGVLLAQKGGQTQFVQFVEKLEEMRRTAAALPADEVLHTLLIETGYYEMAAAMQNGESRLRNLRRLVEYARSYEETTQKGLGGLLHFFDRLEQKNIRPVFASATSGQENSVKIMSIHKSKGLEFPICFVAGCGRAFNKDYNMANILLHGTLGVGMSRKDRDGLYRFTTLPKEILKLRLERDYLSEELRLLYVAMTRAKEGLILVGTCKKPQKATRSAALELDGEEGIDPCSVLAAKTPLTWLMQAFLRHPDATKLRGQTDGDLPVLHCDSAMTVHIVDDLDEETVQDEDAPEEEAFDPVLVEKIREKAEFVYPFAGLSALPAKLTVSDLVKGEAAAEYRAASRPAFLSREGKSAAEAGTALHRFLEICVIGSVKEDMPGQIEAVRQKGLLSERQAGLIDLTQAKRFLDSDLFDRIARSTNVMREKRFTVLLEVKQLQDDLQPEMADEQIVLQGEADLVFEENGELILVDYKTDRNKSAEELKAQYGRQLSLYARGLRECEKKNVRQCFIYSFALGRAIEI